MSGLARGGHAPVLITFMMGTSAIIIGVTIDSLNGLVHLFGHKHKKDKDFNIMNKIEKKYLEYIG